jgi:hypothetical protein
LATVGSFRVVPARDLRDHDGRATDPRDADLGHLRGQGLVQTVLAKHVVGCLRESEQNDNDGTWTRSKH